MKKYWMLITYLLGILSFVLASVTANANFIVPGCVFMVAALWQGISATVDSEWWKK